MAGNILSAVINVSAPGAKETFVGVSEAAGKTNDVLKKLGAEGKLSIGGIQDALKQFKQILAVTTDPKDILKLNTAIAALKGRLSDLNSGSSIKTFDNIHVGTQKASSSILQLSRAFSVLPPEISHLAHSFEGLVNTYEKVREKSSSTGSAIKSFGSLLAGPVGIGLAVSVGISFLTSFIGKLFETEDASKHSEQALASLKDQFSALRDSVRDLNSELEFLNKRGAINIKIAGLPDLLNLNAQMVAQQEVSFKLLEKRNAQANLLANLSLNEQKLNDKDLIEAKKAAQAELSKLDADYQASLRQEGNVAADIRLQKVNDEKEKNKLSEEANKKYLAQLKIDLDFENTLRQLQNDRAKALFKEFRDISGTLSDALVENFNKVNTQIQLPKISTKLELEVFDITVDTLSTNFGIPAKEISTNLKRAIEQLTKSNQILIKANVKVDPTLLLDAQKLQQQAEIIEKAIEGITTDALSSLAEGIGEALAGGDINKGISAFLSVIATGIQSLGKQLIGFAVAQKLAIEATKKFNPYLTAAAGIALVLIGAAMKKAVSKGVEGRALGGTVRANQPYLVGERGAELFVPDTGGKIVNNTSLKAGSGITGSGGMAVQVAGQFVIRGNDLLATIASAQRSQGRLT